MYRDIQDKIAYLLYRITSNPESLTGSSQLQRRYFVILHTILLTGYATTESILPVLQKYTGLDTSLFVLYRDLRNLGESVRFDKEAYGNCIQVVENGYKETMHVYRLSTRGLALLKALGGKIKAEGAPVPSDDEMDDFFRLIYEGGVAKDHRLQIASIYTKCITCLPYPKLASFTFEGGRVDHFDIHAGLRSDVGALQSAVFPDLSFGLGAFPVTPCLLETDLSTESIRSGNDRFALGNKTAASMHYLEGQMLAHDFSPGVIIFIVGAHRTQVALRKIESEPSADAAMQARLFSDPANTMAIAFGMRVFFSFYINFYRRGGFTANGEEAWVRGLPLQGLSVLLDPEKFPDQMPCGNDPVFKKIDAVAGELRRYLDVRCANGAAFSLSDFMAERSAFLSSERESGTSQRLAARRDLVDKRRRALSEFLFEKEEHTRLFNLGIGVSMVPFSDMEDAFKSLLPQLSGITCMKAVFRMLGLPERFDRYWTSRPVLVDNVGSTYSVILRNCFAVGNVYVYLEDLGYDISALSRIRNYIRMHTGLCRGVMLVVVVNDDETIADGRRISSVELCSGGYGDRPGTEVRASYEMAYGKTGDVPFCYSSSADVCFMCRSDYLSGSPEAFLPLSAFIRYSRTSDGMGQDDRVRKYHDREPYNAGTRAVGKFVSYKAAQPAAAHYTDSSFYYPNS